MQIPSLNFKFPRRSESDVVGLDIQPGLVAVAQARVNGAILAERAAIAPLPPDTVREGDIADAGVLSEALRELFAGRKLSKRVRVGVANQRTVMRTLELPPLTDHKELAAAVRFQAEDQVPMPLANAVLDFHPLGVVDTPAGPRQKVVLVAAQRDMIERLLAAVRGAGLQPVGVDMSAFAMIRSLYRLDPEHEGRVLYLNVDGLTNVAIAEGTVCRFTRVLGGGLEEMAVELAERRGVPLVDARAMLASVDLTAAAGAEESAGDAHADTESVQARTEAVAADPDAGEDGDGSGQAQDVPESHDASAEIEPDAEAHAEAEADADAHADADADADSDIAEDLPEAGMPASDAQWFNEARSVLENGIRAISGEVRNSLDFHRAQEGGGDVERVILSGSALELAGFPQALEASLGVAVHGQSVAFSGPQQGAEVPASRLAVAVGLATQEAPQ